ncbi:MAG: cyclic nucleotide-binding domain-containing protein [Proteobacteria bacterium]|nr:MAG: cyclic nucleotide-binding domain-containing protein [Pseudomonadota bacterium]
MAKAPCGDEGPWNECQHDSSIQSRSTIFIPRLSQNLIAWKDLQNSWGLSVTDTHTITALQRAKICEGLEPDLLNILATAFHSQTVPASSEFIKHDAQSRDVFIIVNGIVEIEIPVVGKQNNSSLARLKPGDSVGEFALLRDSRRTATARAVSEVKLIVATSDEVLKLFDQHPRLGYIVCRNLGRIVADRLNDTNMQLRSELSRS